jgi:hypothetical protein
MWYTGYMKERKFAWQKNKRGRIEMPDAVIVEEAEDAIEYALSVRKLHARRTRPGSRQREVDIRVALNKLALAMYPIRRKAAMFVYLNSPLSEEIKEISRAMQRERRKLWKMQRKGTKKRKN